MEADTRSAEAPRASMCRWIAVLAAASLGAAAAAPAALAGSGGVPNEPAARPVGGKHGGTGLTTRRRDSDAPVLRYFRISPTRIYDAAQGTDIRFRIGDRTSRTVRVRLVVIDLGTGKAVRRVRVGRVRSRRLTTFHLTTGDLGEGRYRIRISARDRAGHSLKRGAGISRVERLIFSQSRFPIAGPHDYGGPGSLFGADRGGRAHQGQDVSAAEGTPLVAPGPGVIKYVAYQAGGAGYYVVMTADGADRDYVFMHMKKGSVAVRIGERVATGTRLGEVGTTGDASGPHLHFEVWEGGGWYTGGYPIDPLPLLKAWDSGS